MTQGGSEGSADLPDFEKSKKLSHRNAIKSEFFENWGQIGLSDPLTFGARDAPATTLGMYCYWPIVGKVNTFWN